MLSITRSAGDKLRSSLNGLLQLILRRPFTTSACALLGIGLGYTIYKFAKRQLKERIPIDLGCSISINLLESQRSPKELPPPFLHTNWMLPAGLPLVFLCPEDWKFAELHTALDVWKLGRLGALLLTSREAKQTFLSSLVKASDRVKLANHDLLSRIGAEAQDPNKPSMLVQIYQFQVDLSEWVHLSQKEQGSEPVRSWRAVNRFNYPLLVIICNESVRICIANPDVPALYLVTLFGVVSPATDAQVGSDLQVKDAEVFVDSLHLCDTETYELAPLGAWQRRRRGEE